MAGSESEYGAEHRDGGPENGRRERLLESFRQLVAAQEVERRAIGAQLHNELGQVLTALKLTLGMPGLAGGGEEAEASLDEARRLTAEALERVRDMELQLRPAMLDDLGLGETLDWYLDRMARQAALSLDLHTRGLERGPGPEVETACFRVIQEAVANVVRHAAASTLTVRVDSGPDLLDFEIIDDGEGFDVESVRERSGSQGLDAMEVRLMLLGGGLAVSSRPGSGTRVRGRIPLGGGRAMEGDDR